MSLIPTVQVMLTLAQVQPHLFDRENQSELWLFQLWLNYEWRLHYSAVCASNWLNSQRDENQSAWRNKQTGVALSHVIIVI